ncbi:21519_t:CDS:2, partial [Rhizophagus irregularis]
MIGLRKCPLPSISKLEMQDLSNQNIGNSLNAQISHQRSWHPKNQHPFQYPNSGYCPVLKPYFDDVRRSFTSTRMSLISKYVRDHSTGRFVDWFYDQEFIIRMRQDLNPESHAKYDNIPVYWEKSHFITAMKALVEAEDQGFILEDDLIKEIGYKAVRSLVDYRYLYRRPNFGLNSDLTNPPAESK